MLHSASKKFESSLQHVPGGRQELYYRALCLFRLATSESNVAKAIRQLELAHDILEYPLSPPSLPSSSHLT